MTIEQHPGPDSPIALPRSFTADQAKIAIVLHLFHAEQWPDFRAHLLQMPYDFRLFVTLPPASQMRGEILKSFPQACVQNLPNTGRDVAPFLALLEDLLAFDVVCKLHSKVDRGAHGQWRKAAIEGLLGDAAVIRTYVEAFAADVELALAGPSALYLDGPAHEMQCHAALNLIYVPLPENWGFFAGTMFWCRPQYFAELAQQYPLEIFQSHHDGDGQPEHVVERAFGLIAVQKGLKVMLYDEIPTIAPAADVKGALDWAAIYQRFEKMAGAEPVSFEKESLVALHANHSVLVSDKWSGNLRAYDRLFARLRDKPIRMLEIGVQNGGSLEIWSKYFLKGQCFIGCDIDPTCANLRHGDSRISVQICDAASPAIVDVIAEKTAALDIVIDDGSHVSGDIIRSFALIFPYVAAGESHMAVTC